MTEWKWRTEQAAGLAWQAMTSGNCSDEPERQQKRIGGLLAYCGQTLALVRLFEMLRNVAP